MTHILPCRTESLYCHTERLTKAYLVGPQAQWDAFQPSPHPVGFDHNVCILKACEMYAGTLAAVPLYIKCSRCVCLWRMLGRKGRRSKTRHNIVCEWRHLLYSIYNVTASQRACRVCVCVTVLVNFLRCRRGRSFFLQNKCRFELN